MEKFEIESTREMSLTEKLTVKKALQTLCENVTKDNLVFLADLSKKKDINKKLQDKKGMINLYL